ncbi:DUF4129 domain-containing protein [Streptomyces sp. NPDC059708]|uniref:DUF4129 domain-containing protein n=1 Tax=Streptomyces sp. NPDC059708 TaxID=3346916 RepID=UPI00368CD513
MPPFSVELLWFGSGAAAGARPHGGPGSAPPPPSTSPVPVPAAPPAPAAAPVDAGHSVLTRVLLVLGLALLAASAVLAARLLWRHLNRPAEPDPEAAAGNPGGEREHLAHAVDSGRRALRDTADARAAVIACYLAMEESLAGSGVARRASDSPQDLLERALDGGLTAAAAATELTALFREARYSSHPMDDGHRDRAAAALAALAHALRPPAEEPRAGAR